MKNLTLRMNTLSVRSPCGAFVTDFLPTTCRVHNRNPGCYLRSIPRLVGGLAISLGQVARRKWNRSTWARAGRARESRGFVTRLARGVEHLTASDGGGNSECVRRAHASVPPKHGSYAWT